MERFQDKLADESSQSQHIILECSQMQQFHCDGVAPQQQLSLRQDWLRFERGT